MFERDGVDVENLGKADDERQLVFQTLSESLQIDITQFQKIEASLPLNVKVLNEGLSAGYVYLYRGKDGQSVCEFKTNGEPSTTLHEGIHWLHLASNSELALSELKSNEADNFDANMAMSELVGYQQIINDSMRSFRQRTHLDTQEFGEFPFGERLEQILSNLNDFQCRQLLITLEEAGRVTSKNQWPLSESLDYVIEQKQKQARSRDRNADDDWYNDSILRQVRNTLKTVLCSQTDEQVTQILNEARIDTNPILLQYELMQQQLKELPLEQLISLAQHYFNDYQKYPVTNTVLNAAVFLHDAATMGRIHNLTGDIGSGNYSPELMAEIVDGTVGILNDPQKAAQLSKHQLTASLYWALEAEVKKGAGMASAIADGMLFFGDFPSDEKAAAALLANPQYMAEIQHALLHSPQSPLRVALGGDVSRFAGDMAFTTQQINQQSADLLSKSTDLDLASFVSKARDSQTRISINTCSELLKYNQRAFDSMVHGEAIEIKKTNPDLTTSIVYETARKQVQAKAISKAANSLQETRDARDVLFEPIAHAASKKFFGKEIQFKGGIMGFGSYSGLLEAMDTTNPDSGITKWITKLERLFDKVRSTGDLDVLRGFFRCTTLGQQLEYVNRTLRN